MAEKLHYLRVQLAAYTAQQEGPIDPFTQPVRIEKSVDWLESKILAWKKRQEQMSEVESMFTDIEINPQIKTRPVDDRALPMKESYEAGASLGQICRKYRIGKQTLFARLRAEGTVMRAPGRSGLTTRKAAASERHPWPSVPDRAARANSDGGVA